jgi:hypothetical protein
MPRKKRPYRQYTFEQIQSVEATTYVIVAGKQLFNIDGDYFFDKTTANKFYDKILKESMKQLTEGTESQKRNARKILNNLRVEPLRIH